MDNHRRKLGAEFGGTGKFSNDFILKISTLKSEISVKDFVVIDHFLSVFPLSTVNLILSNII